MNNGDALIAVQEYYDTKNPTPDDEFKFTEALGYLIEETKDPKYMCELGKICGIINYLICVSFECTEIIRRDL